MSQIPGQPISAQQHTSGAETVDILAFTIPADVLRHFVVEVMAKSGANAKCVAAKACVNRQSGAPVIVGSPVVDTAMTTAGASTWPNPTAAIVGNDIIFRVQGVAATPIEWFITIEGTDFNL